MHHSPVQTGADKHCLMLQLYLREQSFIMHSRSLKHGQMETNEVEQVLWEVDGSEFTQNWISGSLNLNKATTP